MYRGTISAILPYFVPKSLLIFHCCWLTGCVVHSISAYRWPLVSTMHEVLGSNPALRKNFYFFFSNFCNWITVQCWDQFGPDHNTGCCCLPLYHVSLSFSLTVSDNPKNWPFPRALHITIKCFFCCWYIWLLLVYFLYKMVFTYMVPFNNFLNYFYLEIYCHQQMMMILSWIFFKVAIF